VYIENGGWQAADSGLSNIDVYLNPSAGSYRVVALDATNPSAVSINSNVWADLTYTKASSTFHQWRDQVESELLTRKIHSHWLIPDLSPTFFPSFQKAGRTYGLNFASQKDADTFERGISDAVNKLKGGGGGGMAGLNLMNSGGPNRGSGAAPAPQRASASMGQGSQMRGGAAMMQTMPKDMGAAFDAQREADIAAFRQMSAAKKAGPGAAPPGPSVGPSRAPPAPTKPAMGGPPPAPVKAPSLTNASGWGNGDVDNGGSGGGGADNDDGGYGASSSDYGADDGGGGGGGEEEFTDAEIEAWRDSVIEAARAEIEMVKQELIEAVGQWYANGGGQGGGGGGGGGGGYDNGYGYDQSQGYDQGGGW
jgi:hypothetical protein